MIFEITYHHESRRNLIAYRTDGTPFLWTITGEVEENITGATYAGQTENLGTEINIFGIWNERDQEINFERLPDWLREKIENYILQNTK